jgi:glycosyltransferase involved in cell wall biosynthesis
MLGSFASRAKQRGGTTVRILFVVSELFPARSGVATAGQKLIEHYRQMGHDVDSLTMRSLPKLVRGELRLSFFFLQWPSIRRRLATYDCVHLNGPAPTFSELFLLLVRITMTERTRPLVVYTHHFELDLPGLGPLCKVYNHLHSRILRLADRVVVTTRAYEQLLLERGHRNVSVIPWGADHRSYPSTPDKHGGFDVLTVGQARSYKGVDVILRAFQQVSGGRLHIVGDGPRRKKHEAIAARLELSSVRFHGELSDVELSRLFATSHVIVLPSITMMEAFGLVLVEGMMAGCVPVASNLPGIAEVIGDAGLLVRPGDAEQLAAALCRLRGDPDLRSNLSERARRRAGSFLWRETSGSYQALLEQLSERVTARKLPCRGLKASG